ncbi:hypothetical protein HMPREF1600_04246 [Escherichia coli 907715]|nr:hypothetical protein HMPREF1600_04246 [Escherichia coli 907715]
MISCFSSSPSGKVHWPAMRQHVVFFAQASIVYPALSFSAMVYRHASILKLGTFL